MKKAVSLRISYSFSSGLLYPDVEYQQIGNRALVFFRFMNEGDGTKEQGYVT